MSQDRMKILQQIEDGQLSAAEALRLLEAAPDPITAAPAATIPATPDPSLQRWKRWWVLPFGIGLGLTVIGAGFMYSALTAWGVGFGLFFASIPFIIGVLIMVAAGWSKSARWLHVRVDTGEDKFPRHIALSFPIPSAFIAWVLRVIPKRNVDTSDKIRTVSEMIAMMDQGITPDAPLFVEVNEGKEKVQVFIG